MKDIMSDDEIRQCAEEDDKKVNKLRKQLRHAYYWKRAAWRALWPFAYTEFAFSTKILRLIGGFRIILYVSIWMFLYDKLNNATIAAVIFGVYYFLRFGIFMFLAQMRIKKILAELRVYEMKYMKIKEDFIRDSFAKMSVIRGEGTYKHRGSNGLTTVVRNNRMYLYGELDDSYGEIRIYPTNRSAEDPDNTEANEYLDCVDKKIASIEFKKYYHVYTNKNNENPCFAYLSPTIMKSYIDWNEESRDVIVYTIRGREIEISMVGVYDDKCLYESIALIEYVPYSGYISEDKENDLYSRFKEKISIYDRYFLDLTYFINAITTDRLYEFVFKEEK